MIWSKYLTSDRFFKVTEVVKRMLNPGPLREIFLQSFLDVSLYLLVTIGSYKCELSMEILITDTPLLLQKSYLYFHPSSSC